MSGFNTVNELDDVVNNQFECVVHAPWQIDCLLKTTLNERLKLWFKLNTGMNRLGFNVLNGEAVEAYDRLMQSECFIKPIKMMTHFSDAFSRDSNRTQVQIDRYEDFINGKPFHSSSAANSAAIMAWPDSHYDCVRPGIMLYGVSPFGETVGVDFNLKPVMQLSSKSITIHQLKKGDRVGYGGAWECPEDMSVGVVDIGYGDGYPRHVESDTPVLVHGKRCPIIGRISMDRLTVDLRLCRQASINDEVIMWGADLPVEEIAAKAGTIAYELLSQVTQRVEFRYE